MMIIEINEIWVEAKFVIINLGIIANKLPNRLGLLTPVDAGEQAAKDQNARVYRQQHGDPDENPWRHDKES